MGLETVVEDIKKEAREKAEEIRREAEEEKEEIIAEAEEEADEIVAEAEEEVEAEIDQKREQTLSSAKLEAKQMKLRKQKELIEDLREDVEDRLAELEEGREDLTEALLEAGINEMDEETGVVYGAEKDEEMIKELLDGYDGFEYGGSTDALGGVIVESSNGEVRVNNTFDSVLETVWRDSLKDISSNLFGEEG